MNENTKFYSPHHQPQVHSCLIFHPRPSSSSILASDLWICCINMLIQIALRWGDGHNCIADEMDPVLFFAFISVLSLCLLLFLSICIETHKFSMDSIGIIWRRIRWHCIVHIFTRSVVSPILSSAPPVAIVPFTFSQRENGMKIKFRTTG